MTFLTLHKETQKVKVVGVDQPEAEVMDHRGDYIAIKVPGHRYQYGAYSDQSSYAPVEIQVYRIDKVDDTNNYLHIVGERILEFPLRKKR